MPSLPTVVCGPASVVPVVQLLCPYRQGPNKRGFDLVMAAHTGDAATVTSALARVPRVDPNFVIFEAPPPTLCLLCLYFIVHSVGE